MIIHKEKHPQEDGDLEEVTKLFENDLKEKGFIDKDGNIPCVGILGENRF